MHKVNPRESTKIIYDGRKIMMAMQRKSRGRTPNINMNETKTSISTKITI